MPRISHVSTESINRCYSAVHCPIVLKFGRLLHYGFAEPACVTGLYLSDFHWGSEFQLATSDYSGHGGCQIGNVE